MDMCCVPLLRRCCDPLNIPAPVLEILEKYRKGGLGRCWEGSEISLEVKLELGHTILQKISSNK